MQDVAEIAFPAGLNEHVEMIKEENIPQHNEGMQFLDVMKDFTQQDYGLRITKNRLAIFNNLCDEHRRTGDIIASEIHYDIIQDEFVGHS